MPRNASTSSTSNLACSSTGASPSVFTWQWGHGLFQVIETTGAEPQVQLLMRHNLGGGHVDHVVRFHCLGTSGKLDLPEPLRSRLAGHFLLTQIPDEGMAEALEALAEMWRFYRERRPFQPALPPAPSVPAAMREPCVRPVFPVAEE